VRRLEGEHPRPGADAAADADVVHGAALPGLDGRACDSDTKQVVLAGLDLVEAPDEDPERVLDGHVDGDLKAQGGAVTPRGGHLGLLAFKSAAGTSYVCSASF